MKRFQENIFSNLTLNFPLLLPSPKQGLQSHRAATDFRQHVSLALELQLSGQYANSLINISTQQQQQAPLPVATTSKPAKLSAKHPPLAASNSVAICNAATGTISKTQHRKLDRSASEPANRQQLQQQQQQQPQPLNSSRYKTELCRPFEENGTCKYGDKCQFAHGYQELRSLSRHPKYKTELCRTFHSTGFCPYGPRCHFIHNSEDSKRCLLDTLQTGNSSLSPSSMDTDICGFSIGSAGELSPNSSSSSGGSCASSLSGYFLDDPRMSHDFRVTFDDHRRLSVPQTAPPTMTSRGFFGGDFVSMNNSTFNDYNMGQLQQSFEDYPLCNSDYPLKAMEDYPLKAMEDYPVSNHVAHQDEYLSQHASSSDEEVPSSIDVLMSELEIELDETLYDCKPKELLYKTESYNKSGLDEPLNHPDESGLEENPEAKKTEAVDINRNLIRLPIFSRLSLGSTP